MEENERRQKAAARRAKRQRQVLICKILIVVLLIIIAVLCFLVVKGNLGKKKNSGKKSGVQTESQAVSQKDQMCIRDRMDGEIEAVLRRVGLDPGLKKSVQKYSLGMRQRLGIAQAIMEDPDPVSYTHLGDDKMAEWFGGKCVEQPLLVQPRPAQDAFQTRG